MTQVVDQHQDHDNVSPFETAARVLSVTGVCTVDDAADLGHRDVPGSSPNRNSKHRTTLASIVKKFSCFKPHKNAAAGTAKTQTHCQYHGEAHLAPIMSVDSRGAATAAASKQKQRHASFCSCLAKHTVYHSVEQQKPWISKQLSSVVEWFEAHSVFSHEIHTKASLRQPNLQQQPTQQQGKWVPDTPLLFADQALHFVPVPKVTGLAGYWELDFERSTQYPLPIHDLIGSSKLVRKIHRSVTGMEIKETDGQLVVSGQPTFIPPGFPAKYCETYDKANINPSSWSLRRDLKLGSTTGKIYMTDTGMLILLVELRSAFRGTVDYIVEDYIQLEEDGQVIKDRMCCYEVATGKRAEQQQVGILRPASA